MWLFFFCALSVHAQTGEVFTHPLTAGNVQRYNALCNDLAGNNYVKGVFEQTRIINSPNRTMVSSGDFIIAADLGIVWITKAPAPSVTTMGQDFMIQSIPGRKKNVTNARGNDTYMNMADTMKSLFTGNAQKLREGFDNYFFERQSPSGKRWTLGLIPKEKTLLEVARWIVLEGSDGGNRTVIESIIFHDKNGGSTSYTFSRHTFPSALEPNEKAYFSVQ